MTFWWVDGLYCCYRFKLTSANEPDVVFTQINSRMLNCFFSLNLYFTDKTVSPLLIYALLHAQTFLTPQLVAYREQNL